MNFKEDFLHFIWKYRLFNQKNLITSSGDPLEIISPGLHNTHSGADFENAKIRINNTLWVGNVEIHIKSSDWERHNHSLDKAYNNVILHVVYQHDAVVLRNDGTEIATLTIQKNILPGIELRYKELMENLSWIPCEKILPKIEGLYFENWLLRILIERLEEKSTAVLSLLEECKGSWDDTFYILLARNFGFKINALPFELLAKSLPQQILAKHKSNSRQIEALVFGQAGLLNSPDDAYALELQKEYLFLQKKYQLQPVEGYLWKFLRIRPQNFPTIRLAQFAALIIKSNHLFSKIVEMENPKAIKNLFKDLPVNEYWKTHYRFGKEVPKSSFYLGESSMHNILLNSVVIALFSFGKFVGNQTLMDRALELLEALPPEANHITERFKNLGMHSRSAASSQALLQLKKYYCDKKNCLNCAVGAKIVKVA